MSLFDTRNAPSMVFAESGNLGSKPLKDKDALREALVYHELSTMSAEAINEFVNSKEAKHMVDKGILSSCNLNKLKYHAHCGKALEFFVCHLAKENCDERWEALCALREKERCLMNELMDDYCEEAKRCAAHHREDFIDPNVPPMFRNGGPHHCGHHGEHHGDHHDGHHRGITISGDKIIHGGPYKKPESKYYGHHNRGDYGEYHDGMDD